MRIDILTILPELLDSPLNHSIIKRAQQKGIAEIFVHNIRNYTNYKHRQVDDYAFSGGAGMVLMIEPIDNLITHLKKEREYDEIIYTSPDGELYSQSLANSLSLKNNLMILCGHYKGIDHRIREHLITMEISIGDYVLTGGELPAMVVIDCVARQIPGVLGKFESLEEERVSSSEVYTRPEILKYKGKNHKVPKVLLSGDHKKIEEWKTKNSKS